MKRRQARDMAQLRDLANLVRQIVQARRYVSSGALQVIEREGGRIADTVGPSLEKGISLALERLFHDAREDMFAFLELGKDFPAGKYIKGAPMNLGQGLVGQPRVEMALKLLAQMVIDIALKAARLEILRWRRSLIGQVTYGLPDFMRGEVRQVGEAFIGSDALATDAEVLKRYVASAVSTTMNQTRQYLLVGPDRPFVLVAVFRRMIGAPEPDTPTYKVAERRFERYFKDLLVKYQAGLRMAVAPILWDARWGAEAQRLAALVRSSIENVEEMDRKRLRELRAAESGG